MTAEILALLDKRMREIEQKMLDSDWFKRQRAYTEHQLMHHSSDELCQCPEWDDARPYDRQR